MPIVIALHDTGFLRFGEAFPRPHQAETSAAFTAEQIQMNAFKAPMPER
ncbi:MAG: hypothetical protein ABR987_18000 [Terracidiphilus sp.]|jgi:hypothetical protein